MLADKALSRFYTFLIPIKSIHGGEGACNPLAPVSAESRNLRLAIINLLLLSPALLWYKSPLISLMTLPSG